MAKSRLYHSLLWYLFFDFPLGPGLDDPVAMVTGTGSYSHAYYFSDHHGSVVATAGDAGGLTGGPLLYDPHGNCLKSATACQALGANAQPYYFTGMRLDRET